MNITNEMKDKLIADGWTPPLLLMTREGQMLADDHGNVILKNKNGKVVFNSYFDFDKFMTKKVRIIIEELR